MKVQGKYFIIIYRYIYELQCSHSSILKTPKTSILEKSYKKSAFELMFVKPNFASIFLILGCCYFIVIESKRGKEKQRVKAFLTNINP